MPRIKVSFDRSRATVKQQNYLVAEEVCTTEEARALSFEQASALITRHIAEKRAAQQATAAVLSEIYAGYDDPDDPFWDQ